MIQVQDMHGETAQEFRHDIADVAPGGSIRLDDLWDTSSAQDGTYSILRYVLYDSMATEPGVAVVSTRRLPGRLYLPIIAKSYP